MISRMSDLSRRDFSAGVGAFAMLAAVMAEAQAGQPVPKDGTLLRSVLFRYDELPVKNNANGGTSRQVLSGTLKTGEFVEVHETTLPAGQMPHPPHRHSHSEFLLIREGTLQYLDEGQPMAAGPGDVVFTASGRLHGLKNVGTTMASYFVVAVGVQKAE